MQDYSAIFALRAAQYHLAMRTHPHARDGEFGALLEDLPADAIDVLDVPSGGGYLDAYLPAGTRLSACDFSVGFAAEGAALASPERLPFADAGFDAVLSLTGLHHVPAPRQDAFLAECRRVLRPGGRLLVGEVLAGSPVDAFLNGFVHRYNSQGHEGVFFDAGFIPRLQAAGFAAVAMQVRHYPWRFESEAAMRFYCRHMFGIDRADDDTLAAGLAEHLAYRIGPDGAVVLPWQLVFFQGVKR